MILNISDEPITVIENDVYRFQLINYPHIEDYEFNNIITFISYEKSHGRETEIICKDNNVLSLIKDAVAHFDGTEKILQLKGNEFVYHATDIKAAKQILASGKLLSSVKLHEKSGEELAYEKNKKYGGRFDDPPDYFEYIMFCEGDTPTGDYVVLSEDFPSENDLVSGNFNAGVRFYFRYEDIVKHPGHAFDGYHVVKVKEEIVLSDYLYACIVPEQYKVKLDDLILPKFASKLYFLHQKGIGLQNWNEKVYDFVSKI